MVKDKFWIGLISGLVLAALASGAAVVAGVSLNYTPKIWPETIDQRPLSDDEINTLAIATDENPNVIRFDFSTAHQSLTLSADVYEYGRLVKPNAYNRTSSPQQASKGTLWLTWKNDAGILGAALGNESSIQSFASEKLWRGGDGTGITWALDDPAQIFSGQDIILMASTLNLDTDSPSFDLKRVQANPAEALANQEHAVVVKIRFET